LAINFRHDFYIKNEKLIMKQVAVIMVLILAGIVILNTKPKDVGHTTQKEEGADDLIGQEALKHL
jgi:hypothetical protein